MPKPLPPPWDRFVPFAQKVFVWALVFLVLWLLRPFFFLVFLTFVFGYILEHFVQRTAPRIRSRRVRVVIGFLLLLGLLVGIGTATGPALAQQAKEFPRQVREKLGELDDKIEEFRRGSPTVGELIPKDMEAADIIAQAMGFDRPAPRRPAGEVPVAGGSSTVTTPPAPAVSLDAFRRAAEGLARATRGLEGLSEGGEAAAAGLNEATEGLALAAESLAEVEAEPEPEPTTGPAIGVADLDAADEKWKNVLPLVISIAERSFAIGSAFLLSLLFSFLIVFDFPNLARGARHLHDTRLQFVYDEISDNVFHFGRVLGQALEAQLMIAIINTGFTAIGLWVMELPNIAFLSMVVFICSFIPVAGVFISSVPICLTALTTGDFELMLWAIAFITVIHMIEAYILNPRIYGAHLRMNPVLVLAILVISHHLFGVWGLILGVPVVNYFVKHVIEVKARQHDEPTAAAA